MTAQEYIARGYRRISNSGRIISRIDREDWKDHMAKMHSPWSKKQGDEWVEGIGDAAADYYRRCHSVDLIRNIPHNTFKQIPNSNWDTTGYIP